KADAATFLHEVHEHAAAFACDPRERRIELRPTIAAQRAHHFTREAARVHAREHRGPGHIAEHHRDMLFLREPDRTRAHATRLSRAIHDDAKLAVRGRKAGVGIPRKHAVRAVYGWLLRPCQCMLRLQRYGG